MTTYNSYPNQFDLPMMGQYQPTFMASQQQQQQQQLSSGYYQIPIAQPQPQHGYPSNQYFNQQIPSHHRAPSIFQQNTQQQPIILPPPGMIYGDNIPNQQIVAPPVQSQPQPQVTEEKVNGGVSEVLDYDISLMSEYIVKSAYIAFGMESALVNKEKDVTLQQNVDLFMKGIESVLNATRLPSITVFLALDYLFKYLDKLPNGTKSIGGNTLHIIYQNTMVAFILANKFNDDKTFTNKSWSQATGMDNMLINEFERTWLDVFDWKLYDDKFIFYDDFAYSFEIFCQEKQNSIPLPNAQTMVNVGLPQSQVQPQQGLGYQTPSAKNSNLFASSYYFPNTNSSEDVFFRNNNTSSPVPAVTSKDDLYSSNGFNYDFYNFGPSNQKTHEVSKINLGLNPTWNNDLSNFHTANLNPSNNYFTYPVF